MGACKPAATFTLGAPRGSNIRGLASWVRIGDGEFEHRTGLSKVGLLVPNYDIALSPEDVVTLSRANRAAQGSGN
ncbi:hypothetical protein T492DRAFT_860211, partial [Pavlovales sp. CCMP2436]